MIVLDTCTIIYDALIPKKLGKKALQAINRAEKAGQLLCSDISLWEIAMLISKNRLDPGTDYHSFIKAALAARRIHVQDISPEIANLAVSLTKDMNTDPADCIIAATAVLNNAVLVTCDNNLRQCEAVKTVW